MNFKSSGIIEYGEELFEQVHDYYGRPYNQPLLKKIKMTSYLEQWAIKQPHLLFIKHVDKNGVIQTITYKECYEMVRKVAQRLSRRYGVSLGHKVGIIPRNSIESVVIILAINYLNATAVILNGTEPENRLKEQVEFVECSLVISDGQHFEMSTVELNKLIAENQDGIIDENIFKNELWLDSPAIILFTTGTTSSSKAVVQSDYNIAINCTALVKHHKLDCKSVLMCILPIYYANGLEFTIFSTLIAGASVLLCEVFDPFSYLQLLRENRVTIASVVPSVLNTLLDGNGRKVTFSEEFRYFVSAAAPLSVQTSVFVYEKWGQKIIQGYGLTETTNFSLKMPTNLNTELYNKLMLETDIPSVGLEVYGNQVAILNADGEIVPDGTVGEVAMRGHNVMMGYLNNEQANQETFSRGWFHSGDLGKFITGADGERFLILTGRIKNIVKSGGNLISLEDIDRILAKHPSIKEAISCPVPDEQFGEIVGTIISLRGKMTHTQVLDYLSEHMSKTKIPKHIKFIDEIPKTKNGKINRIQLSQFFFK